MYPIILTYNSTCSNWNECRRENGAALMNVNKSCETNLDEGPRRSSRCTSYDTSFPICTIQKLSDSQSEGQIFRWRWIILQKVRLCSLSKATGFVAPLSHPASPDNLHRTSQYSMEHKPCERRWEQLETHLWLILFECLRTTLEVFLCNCSRKRSMITTA